MAERDRQISAGKDSLARALVHQILAPLAGTTVAVAVATGRWDLNALLTGLAVTGSLTLFWKLDRTLVYPYVKRIPQDWLRMETELFVSLAGHLLGALLALIACGYLLGFAVRPSTSWLLFLGIVLAFPIIHGAEMALGYYRQLREKEHVEQELRALATQAELRALKAQINPHFFFNTLNTIAALIHTNPTMAENSIERLAQMFRYVLASSEKGQVTLAEELAFVDDYLAAGHAPDRATGAIRPCTRSLPSATRRERRQTWTYGRRPHCAWHPDHIRRRLADYRRH